MVSSIAQETLGDVAPIWRPRTCVKPLILSRDAPYRYSLARAVAAGTIDFFVDEASFEPATRAAEAAAHTELRAPFNGKVIAIKAQPGATVARGDTLLVIESMKLEHSLPAVRDAVIKAIHVQPGQQAATAQVLVTFEAMA